MSNVFYYIHESVAGFPVSLKAEQHLRPWGGFDNVADEEGVLTET